MMVLATTPLKWALQVGGNARWCAAAGYSALLLIQSGLWLSGLWGQGWRSYMQRTGGSYYEQYGDTIGFYFVQFWFGLSMTTITCALSLDVAKPDLQSPGVEEVSITRPKCTEFIAWGLILLIFLPSILLYEPLGAWVHDMLLFVLGFVTQRFSIFGQRELANFISSYWPLVLIWPVGAMHIPYAPARRMDQFPLHDMSERARFSGIEFVFVLAFLVCGTPAAPLGRQAPCVICKDTFGVLPALNRWALFAYMCHLCFLRVMPSPYSYIAIYCSAGAFWFEDFTRRRANKSKPPEVFGKAWAVLILPCLVWLWGVASTLAFWCCVGLCCIPFFHRSVKDCKAASRGDKATVQMPDGATPLTVPNDGSP